MRYRARMNGAMNHRVGGRVAAGTRPGRPGHADNMLAVRDPGRIGPKRPHPAQQAPGLEHQAGPTTVFTDLGPTWTGPGLVADCRIQPWLLLKTQARVSLQFQPALNSTAAKSLPRMQMDRCKGLSSLNPSPFHPPYHPGSSH